MGVSEGKISGRARRIDGCRPDDITAFKRTMALSGLSRLLQSRLGEWGEAAAAATDCATFAFAAAHIVCATADPKLNIATKRRQKQHEHLKDAHKKSGAPSFVYTRRLLWVVVSAAAATAPPISGRRGALGRI